MNYMQKEFIAQLGSLPFQQLSTKCVCWVSCITQQGQVPCMENLDSCWIYFSISNVQSMALNFHQVSFVSFPSLFICLFFVVVFFFLFLLFSVLFSLVQRLCNACWKTSSYKQESMQSCRGSVSYCKQSGDADLLLVLLLLVLVKGAGVSRRTLPLLEGIQTQLDQNLPRIFLKDTRYTWC